MPNHAGPQPRPPRDNESLARRVEIATPPRSPETIDPQLLRSLARIVIAIVAHAGGVSSPTMATSQTDTQST